MGTRTEEDLGLRDARWLELVLQGGRTRLLRLLHPLAPSSSLSCFPLPEDEQASPAGCICGIIPATPCLERHSGLTEMFINDSAGRWDSGGLVPPAALPGLCLSCGLSSGPASNTLRLRARHSSRLYCRDEFREQQAGPDQTLTVGNNLVCFPRARRENKR